MQGVEVSLVADSRSTSMGKLCALGCPSSRLARRFNQLVQSHHTDFQEGSDMIAITSILLTVTCGYSHCQRLVGEHEPFLDICPFGPGALKVLIRLIKPYIK